MPADSSIQTITEHKLEGQENLSRWKTLLAKNEHTAEEIKELEYISKRFGKHPLFKKASSTNYDARAMHSGFGAPDCYCHINPPCQACVDWTNYCDDRQNAVEVNKEPGCTVIGHGCDADGTA